MYFPILYTILYIILIGAETQANAHDHTLHTHSVFGPNNSAMAGAWAFVPETRWYYQCLPSETIVWEETKKKKQNTQTNFFSCSEWLCIHFTQTTPGPPKIVNEMSVAVHSMWLYYALRFRLCSRSPYRPPWDITFNVMSTRWQPWARPFRDRKYVQQGHLWDCRWAPFNIKYL